MLLQLLVQAIVDCRFFTLFAVAGSLLGSVLCFLEVIIKLSQFLFSINLIVLAQKIYSKKHVGF